MNNALMRPLLLLGVMCMLQACAVDAQEPTPKPNIILISLDTLRADRVGGPDGLTPNLDLLAQESWTFRKAYAQSTETLFSHASMFSGRYPSELSTVDYHFSYPENIPTMAQVLRLYGYKTGGSVAGGHLSPAFGLGQGFDHYAGPEEWGSLWHTAPAALGWVDGLNNEPFFLFLHGYDTHSRYLKPSPVGYMYASMTPPGPGQGLVRSIHGTAQVVDGVWHRRRRFDQLVQLDALRPHSTSARAKIQPDEDAISLQPVDLERIRKIYDSSVTYADLQIGLLMGELEKRGLLETTWIIVMSDHGEELGENGFFNHRLHMGEELLRVPLIIRPPGGLTHAQQSNRLTGLIDLMPTVLELAGAQAPAGLHGASLMPTLRGEAQPAPSAVFAEGPWRIVAAVGEDGGLMFSGLSAHSKRLAQAMQATPLTSPAYESWGMAEKPKLKADLQKWRSSLTPHTPQRSADSEARRKILQQRGYWGGP